MRPTNPRLRFQKTRPRKERTCRVPDLPTAAETRAKRQALFPHLEASRKTK